MYIGGKVIHPTTITNEKPLFFFISVLFSSIRHEDMPICFPMIGSSLSLDEIILTLRRQPRETEIIISVQTSLVNDILPSAQAYDIFVANSERSWVVAYINKIQLRGRVPEPLLDIGICIGQANSVRNPSSSC